MKLVNVTKDSIIADKVSIAKTFIQRLTGLLKHKSLPEGECLVITPCNSVHTFFMRFDIDVIFLDVNNQIVHLMKTMPPSRVSPIIKQAKCVIELPAGTLEKLPCDISDKIIWQEER